MRYFLVLLAFTFLCPLKSRAQFPVYYFSISTDTAYESNTMVIAGYVKTNTAPAIPDSVTIMLRHGLPVSTHMDTSSEYIINFSPGQDSVAFRIRIFSDTFPEYPEHVQYVLTNPVNGSSIGTDSSLLFVLIDTTPPAIISFVMDSAWYYEDQDSFNAGVYYPSYNTYPVGIKVNNPNPFYIRYSTTNIDCLHSYLYPNINACYFTNFYFNPTTYYAPPGVSIVYQTAYIVDQNSTSDKYFYCLLRNIDANLLTDSLLFFTIKHVNYFDTPTLSFNTNSITIVADSFQHVGIPITIINPNMKPLYFQIDTIQTSATYPGINYTFNNQKYGYGHGISHDTFWVDFINTHLTGDTISMTFALRNDSVNSSPDTIINITVIDTGSLMVSFLGAGMSHLKSDSIGYVQVYTSSFAKFPISVDVSYLTGNAIRDTDFTFNDTTIVFPAFSFDTISLPVVMLQDHRSQGNTQVVLQLTNVSPSNLQYGITQYTYIIIDDEDSGLVSGVHLISTDNNIKAYPNPFDNAINIETTLTKYNINITNSIGEIVYDLVDQHGNLKLNLYGLPTGLYLVRMSNGEYSYTKKILKL